MENPYLPDGPAVRHRPRFGNDPDLRADHVFLQSDPHRDRACILCAHRHLADPDAALSSPPLCRRGGRRSRARSFSGADDSRHPHREVACPRCAAASSLGGVDRSRREAALCAFLLLSQRLTAPLLQMAKLINQYDEARIAVAVVAELVNQPPEEGRYGHGVRAPLEGHVQLSNVTFKYRGASSPALQDVSFEVPVGTTLGIMGRSGSGKTTVARLLQRLHSNYEGLIKIDGIDVREYDVDHLRRSLGVVLQENFLFTGTIRENIIAAKTDATFEEVVRAARLSGAEEFIDRLPRGYETHIYEGSPNLSGGQRQRLAIARALIVDPRILILDEATSALDADSEAIVNANISRIAHGRTVIIISHRLSSLVSADAVLVLERGCVHDIGRHGELLERCDIYSNLWHQQTQHVTASRMRGDRRPFGGKVHVS